MTPLRGALQENRSLQARIAALQASPTPLEAAKTKHDDHVSDRDKFKKLIDNLQVISPLSSLAIWQNASILSGGRS